MNIRNAKVLIVDDEVHILHVLHLKLSNAGYTVITAEDGEEGLAKALEHLPDMIITDYQMPLMTGLEMCVALHQEASVAAVPVLMLTARGFALEREFLDQTAITGVISKPFSPREVLHQVQALIGDVLSKEAEQYP